jgi:hypothetical protein
MKLCVKLLWINFQQSSKRFSSQKIYDIKSSQLIFRLPLKQSHFLIGKFLKKLLMKYFRDGKVRRKILPFPLVPKILLSENVKCARDKAKVFVLISHFIKYVTMYKWRQKLTLYGDNSGDDREV